MQKMHKNKIHYQENQILEKRMKRSKFDLSHEIKTTLNAGDLIPLTWDILYPGDKINIDIANVTRMATLQEPIMDNSYIEVMAFNVPWYTIWDDTFKFFGENDEDAFDVKDAPEIPQTLAPDEGWKVRSIADHLGLPINKPGIKVSSLPFRAFAKIKNDWFRDQNLQNPCGINKTNATTIGNNGNNEVTDTECGGMPPKACKYKDYFTTALPAQQKGTAPTLNIGGMVPVTTQQETHTEGVGGLKIEANKDYEQGKYYKAVFGKHADFDADLQIMKTEEELTGSLAAKPINLWANLATATGINISEFRNLATLQQMLEKDARGGTRYPEYTNSHFGVITSDKTLWRSEYLGGIKKPITVSQVASTVTTELAPQAKMAGWGYTNIQDFGTVNKTVEEHSIIMIVGVVRYKHTYQQGVECNWTKKSKYDFYDPIFANISEQPIKNSEIFFNNTEKDNETFGFKPAWEELRKKYNKITGYMRSMEKDSLDIWHFADHYQDYPSLGNEWIKEDPSNISRTLAINSEETPNAPQYITDFFFNWKCERSIPITNNPGINKI